MLQTKHTARWGHCNKAILECNCWCTADGASKRHILLSMGTALAMHWCNSLKTMEDRRGSHLMAHHCRLAQRHNLWMPYTNMKCNITSQLQGEQTEILPKTRNPWIKETMVLNHAEEQSTPQILDYGFARGVQDRECLRKLIQSFGMLNSNWDCERQNSRHHGASWCQLYSHLLLITIAIPQIYYTLAY